MAKIPQKCWSLPGFSSAHDACLRNAQRLAAELEWDPETLSSVTVCGPEYTHAKCEALLFDDCRQQLISQCQRHIRQASTRPAMVADEEDDSSTKLLVGLGVIGLAMFGAWWFLGRK